MGRILKTKIMKTAMKTKPMNDTSDSYSFGLTRFMCNGKRFIDCLLVIVLFTLGACTSSQGSDLKLKISSVDSVFESNRVLVHMTLTNVGDTNIILYSFDGKIQRSMGGILHFNIIRNDIDTLVCHPVGAIPKYPHERDTASLAPEEVYEEAVNLTSFYVSPNVKDTSVWDSTSAMGIREWEPGIYSVQCRYQYRHQPSFKGGHELWRGSATSNIIYITIPE